MSVVEWKPIRECPPYRTVLLYRLGTLYPVVGFMFPGPNREGTCHEDVSGRTFWLEEGGQEDDEDRVGLQLRESALPTHWAYLPEIPLELLMEADIRRRDKALEARANRRKEGDHA